MYVEKEIYIRFSIRTLLHTTGVVEEREDDLVVQKLKTHIQGDNLQ